MSIIGNILGGPSLDPGYGYHDSYFWPVTAGRQTTAGEWVSGETAMALPVYWACIQAISMDIAKLAVHVYRRDGDSKAPDDSHYLAPIIRDEPNPEMSSLTFIETLTQWALGWGNGYAERVMDGSGRTVELWPIHPSRVEVKRRDSDGGLFYRVRQNMGTLPRRSDDTERELGPDEVFHLRGLGNGVEGHSVFRVAAESIGYAMAARRHGAAFFGNGLGINYVLQHPEILSEEALKHLREDLRDRHGGPHNAFTPFIAEEGMTVQKLSVDPKEAQVLECLMFQVEEVCRWFRMPPHKVQHLQRSTFSNIEHQSIEYVVDTIMPWVRRWETEIKRKLLLPAERAAYFVEFSLESLLRADSKSRAEFYQIMQQNGNYTINDVLRKENMNSIGEVGDTRFVMVNTQPIERAVSGQDGGAGEPDGEDREDDADAMAIAATGMVYPELARAVKRQAAQFTAAARKHAGDRPAFAAWLDKFHNGGPKMVGLASELADSLGHIGAGIGRMTGLPGCAAKARAFAADHCRRMAATMLEAFDGDHAAIEAGAWERDGLAASESSRLASVILGGGHA